MPVLPGDSPFEALLLQFPLPFVTDNGRGLAQGGDGVGIANASSFSFPEGRSGGAVDLGFLSADRRMSWLDLVTSLLQNWSS